MHLEPFTEEDALTFLTAKLGAARASEVIDHFQRHGLRGFLGNPQTLEMIERVAPTGELPCTSSELFERTVDIVWKEHRDDKAADELSRAQALDAAGAAFAALLLTGSEAISRRARANIDEGDLALPQVEEFDSGRVGLVFATRLFRSLGADRFSYWHRRIGEYLAARWLAHKADTRAKRRRLISLFQSQRLVPTSLRGLHAWLALDPELAHSIIDADPMGVVEYGDADVLDPRQASRLLNALRRVAAEDPRFRDAGRYRAKGLVQPAMLADLQATIDDPGAPFGLKLLLLEQLESANIASDLKGKLTSITIDPQRSYAERASAAKALAALPDQPDWQVLVAEMWRLADQESTRLAAEILGHVGFGLFIDREIAEVVLAHCGVTICAVPRRKRDRVVGTLFSVRRALPADRIVGVLDVLTDYLEHLVTRGDNAPDDVTSLILGLTARAISESAVSPDQLYQWLSCVSKDHGHGGHARKTLAAAICAQDSIRRALQKRILLNATDGRGMRHRALLLRKLSEALPPSSDDLLHLMGELNPDDRTDLRWKHLLELERHDDVAGAELRAAAKVFAAHRRDLLQWIDRLAAPRAPSRQKRQKREGRRRDARSAMERAESRNHFQKHLAEMRAGDGTFLVGPAECYMNQFSDVREGLDPVGRIVDWFGQEVATAALEGFEAYLVASPPDIRANEISSDLANNQRKYGGSIIVAALGQRMLSGQGFANLAAERVMAGWLLLVHKQDEDAGLYGLSEVLAENLRKRRKWRSTLVLLIEPQLKMKRVHIEYLHELTESASDAQLATDLALGWLRRINEMADAPERSLIARVLASGRRAELSAIAKARLVMSNLEQNRRRSWLAVLLLVDLNDGIAQLGTQPIETELLWELRSHLGERRRDGERLRGDLTLEQLVWIVQTFRVLWPACSHPSGATTGDANPWGATDFLNGLISRIGDGVGDTAISAINKLQRIQDGYSYHLQVVAAEQRRKLVETRYTPPPLETVAAALAGTAPTSAADLQAAMLEELEVIQARLKGDPIDWYKGFFKQGGAHKNEEDCRDELLKMLDGKVPGVQLRPESHMADEKRVDIECSASATVMIPIEVKGQWHPAVWSAADDQLDKLYASDWRADRRGIYLVLWFGASTSLTKPPSGQDLPTTPSDLRDALNATSRTAKSGLVEVVVLDLTRP